MSESVMLEKDKEYILFHGKNIRSKKFQNKINKKASLTHAILLNTAIIVISIMVVWIFVIIRG